MLETIIKNPNKKDVKKLLREFLNLPDFEEKFKKNEEIKLNGKIVEPYEYPLKLIELVGDMKLTGYCERVWEEWAGESGDYEGGILELIECL